MNLLTGPRVVTEEKLTRDDFEYLAKRLGEIPKRARKVGLVAARQADQIEQITTHWNGTETENTAQPGDWIVTNLSPAQEPLRDRDGNLNTYVILQDRFPQLYDSVGSTPHGQLFKAKSTVLALRLAGGFDIVAQWGERQRADDGYLILNGEEVYGNNAETFEATYELVPGRACL